MSYRCGCPNHHAECQLVAITGGPGAGKTAVLEVVRRHFCQHVTVLPEAASILFSGGVPRVPDLAGRRAAQRAIFHVQVELERMVRDAHRTAVVLCDRGTIDGLAYWDGDPDDLWRDVGVTRAAELARYAAVIHLRSPRDGHGYNHQNPMRTEDSDQAEAIDTRILAAWDGHPHRVVIQRSEDFVSKLARTLEAVRGMVPTCCRPAAAELDGELGGELGGSPGASPSGPAR
jgi:predicted ATPase